MEYLLLGFFTGLKFNLSNWCSKYFCNRAGFKKTIYIFVCIICSLSDLILIFLGIFLFQYFGNFFNSTIEFILNILLFIFLVHFIYGKISIQKNKIDFNQEVKSISLTGIITKTLAFTYLNPHVYSDTVFFLGNFSKNLLINDKYLEEDFGIGLFAKFLSHYAKSHLESIKYIYYNMSYL